MSGLEGLLAGRTLVGRYRVEEVIGRGGFAAVYRAVDERLGRTVAVKVITLGSSDSETRDQIRQRFDREARAAASLHHPNVVTVYDFGTDTELGLDFLVMELLRGEDLRARLARPDPLPAKVAVRVVRDAAWGLGAGHAGGLIHRDVKPGNIFLVAQERAERFRVCVLDFGIAQIKRGEDTTTRFTRGPAPLSPAYASPEQLRAERHLTPASDVFGLGVIGYQMLAGERPFGPTEVDRMAHREPVPVPSLRDRAPEVPEGVEAVILRALSFDPADRFPDARTMADALDQAYSAMRDAPVAVPVPEAAPVVVAPAPPPEALPVPPVEEPAPPPRAGAASYARPRPRRRFRAAPLAVLLLLVAGALAAWWALGREGDPEPRVARAPAAPAAPAGPITGGTDTVSWHAPPPTGSPRPGSPGTATTQRTTTPQPAGPRTAVDGGAPAAGVPGTSARPSASGPAAAAPPRAPATQPGQAPRPVERPTPRPAPPPARVPPPASGNARTLNAEGERYFERGELQTAVDRFRRAVRAAPGNAYYRNNLGWALFQAGDVDGAGRELREAIRLDPRRDIAYANLGEVHWARGERAAAIAAYERFLELNTNARRERIASEKVRRMRAASNP